MGNATHMRLSYLAKAFECRSVIFIDIIKIRALLPFHFFKDNGL